MIRTNRMICAASCLCFAALLAFVALPGCNKATEVTKSPVTGKDKTDNKTKAHPEHPTEGPHGGALAEWGNDEYHAEFTVDADKKLVMVYILDGEAKEAPKVEAAKITEVRVTFIGSKQPPDYVDLKHDAKASSDKGIAFSGTHEKFAKPEGIEVEIGGKVGDAPFNGKVTFKGKKKTASFYQTPGGIYTADDIKKNGGKTAAEKYAGKSWAHDDNLVKGDRICPVTKNKADPECSWIVQGQTYQFCCHPCVDKFVRQAHDEQGSKNIKNANEYIFKGM